NAGQEVGIQAVTAAIDSKTEPVLKWLGPTGAAVAESRSGWLAVVCPEAGAYSLTIHDREFRGGKDYSYRLQVGTVPIVSSVFPLGLKRGTEREFHLTGVHLNGQKSMTVAAPADSANDKKLALPIKSELGPVLGISEVAVSEFPESDSPG